ncbi:MAG: hypothetical protein RLZZ245_1925 [Verrucomicrobiota bacterium]|jgi:hypothetical protein
MANPQTSAALFLGSILSAAAAEPLLTEFETARSTFTHSAEMDFDPGQGSLRVSKFEIRSLLSRPITPLDGLKIIPMAEYRLTDLDFDGISSSYPIRDEEIHSLNLSAVAFSKRDDSRWIYGAWARAKMNSDFQDIGEDDFKFDLAAGAGYTFNPDFTLGFGATLLNLNGDEALYPGLFFNWNATEQIRVGLYGPIFVIHYSPAAPWQFSFRADPSGETANITDSDGKSRAIEFQSYRIGLYANRRISDHIWLRAGAGITLGNEINLTETNGDERFGQNLDDGMFAQVALRLVTW